MLRSFLAAVVLLILLGGGSGCTSETASDQAGMAPRQAGTLTTHEPGTASEARPPADAEAEAMPFPDEAEANQRIMSLSAGSPDEAEEQDGVEEQVITLHAPVVVDGDVDLSTVFADGTDDLGDVEVFTSVEDLPELLDGTDALQVDVAAEGVQAGTRERVVVHFVVDTEGRVRQAQVAEEDESDCSYIAPFVVQDLAFTPGRQRGRPVHVRMSLPVTCTYQ